MLMQLSCLEMYTMVNTAVVRLRWVWIGEEAFKPAKYSVSTASLLHSARPPRSLLISASRCVAGCLSCLPGRGIC